LNVGVAEGVDGLVAQIILFWGTM